MNDKLTNLIAEMLTKYYNAERGRASALASESLDDGNEVEKLNDDILDLADRLAGCGIDVGDVALTLAGIGESWFALAH